MTDAKVYVGTYAKYNNGSIEGAWLSIEDYTDHDDFMTACHALHSDESDPEFMFQDFEGFPKFFYGESSINPELWDFLDLSDYEQRVFIAYLDQMGTYSGGFDDINREAQDAVQGEYDSVTAFADEQIEIAISEGQITRHWANHIDSQSYWDSELRHGYFEQSGFIFMHI